jgi:hypothetical protein
MYEGWKKRCALSTEWVARTDSFLDHAFSRSESQRPVPMLGALVASVGTFISLTGGLCR